ncbi:MAG TPA: (d)CMP kinase [Tepidisphaeraceae bacterium]|jgi:cytidylate kinase|nr:(d)CMP kinase [Tepidisphaeraceae bacterium]
MIITIDGPAGTGKSTVAQAVAQELGFDFLDTGAMYRAIGLAALRRHANLDDPRELTYVARLAKIEFDFAARPPIVTLNGEPVGHLLRAGDATRAASFVAVVPAVRELLVKQQQEIGAARPNLVTEGRDQGSVVFPQAELKFYLDATPVERARRRANQLRARGEMVDIGQLQTQIMDRDARDAKRAVAPLAVPQGAEVIDTTEMSLEDVIGRIVGNARRRA